MKIALDWDGTVTEDHATFLEVTRLFRAAGHEVYIVTMRYPTEGLNIPQVWKDLVNGIIFTCRNAKHPIVESRGIKIDVWIDDNPKAIHQNAAQAFGHAAPEGLVITGNVNGIR